MPTSRRCTQKRNAWLVRERCPERLELKRKCFGKLDELSPRTDAILASNSSSYAADVLDNVGHLERVANTNATCRRNRSCTM